MTMAPAHVTHRCDRRMATRASATYSEIFMTVRSHIIRGTLASLALAAGGSAPLLAQQPADSVRQLAPLVTTATRTPTKANELPQRVITISREEIERTPAADAVDLLKKLGGVDVIQYPGLLGQVSVRGFRPSSGTQTRTLILLDGRPAGSYNLSLLDMSSIERIEVLRGPASALYGSSAQGGVVNFITRRSTGQLGGSLSAAYGSFATSEIMARAGGVLGRPGGRAVDMDVNFRRYEQGNNFRLGRGGVFRDPLGGDKAAKSYPGSSTPSREVADDEGDGIVREFTTFKDLSGGARVGVELPGSMRVDVRGDIFNADDVLVPGDVFQRLSDFNGNSRKNVSRHTEEITLRRELAQADVVDGLTHMPLARIYNAREENEAYDDPGANGYVNYVSSTSTAGIQLQDVMRFGAQALTVGVDASRVESESQRFQRTGTTINEIGTYSPNSRATSAAAFVQAQLSSAGGRVTGVVGGRLDRVSLDLLTTPFRPDVTAGKSDFTVFNPNAGVQVQLTSGLRAHATIGRAFLNPDASNLAGYSTGGSAGTVLITTGNPNLDPEHSVTVDGGLSFSSMEHGLDLDVTYFNTEVSDRISTARATFPEGGRPTTAGGDQISGITTYANSGTAHIRGLEAELRYDVGRAFRQPFSLAFFATGTRLLRAEESSPLVLVDTVGLSAVQNLDASAVFGRITLDRSVLTTMRIKNVANFSGTVGVEYDDFSRFSGRLGARYVGHRLDSDFSDFSDPGDIEYAPFMVMDLTAAVRVAGRYTVEGQVSNLTDENYYEKRGYNMPGRAFRLRVKADF